MLGTYNNPLPKLYIVHLIWKVSNRPRFWYHVKQTWSTSDCALWKLNLVNFIPTAGGFSKVDPSSNDQGIEGAKKAISEKLVSILNKPVTIHVLQIESQVVAGMNYKMKIKAEDSHFNVKYYDAHVWGMYLFTCI